MSSSAHDRCNGVLHAQFFPYARPALTAWHRAGIAVHVYSSGSVRNPQDWFAGGSLAELISGWFDLTTAGSKHKASSYERVARAIGRPAHDILFLSDFLSDHPDELDAAVAARWSVLGVTRSGEPNLPRAPHRWIASLNAVEPRQGNAEARSTKPETKTPAPNSGWTQYRGLASGGSAKCPPQR
jgi:enolase-phosphatase E1